MKAEDIRELIYEAKARQTPDPEGSADLIGRLVYALEDALPALYVNDHLTRADLADYLGLANEDYLAALPLPAQDSPHGWKPATIAFWDRNRTKREISPAEYEAAAHPSEHPDSTHTAN